MPSTAKLTVKTNKCKLSIEAIREVASIKKIRFPRSLWHRKPFTQVVPNKRKEEQRRKCRKKIKLEEYEEEEISVLIQTLKDFVNGKERLI